MASKLNLRSAEQLRLNLTKSQQRQIEAMYKRVSKQIAEEAKNLPDTTSGSIRKVYLKQLQKQINAELDSLGNNLEDTILNNMDAVARGVVKDNIAFHQAINLTVQGMFSRVPGDVVKTVSTGQVYGGDWSLSRAIWFHTKKAKADINSIIAQGIAMNKGSYDIAKDLEKYVNPSAKKEWDWNKVYPGTAKKIDYNAQRLARTLVTHAYQQAFVRTTQPNPFVTKYKWLSSNSHRVCPLCASRDGELFEKNSLPLDHPNGMCTVVAVMESSMLDIADRIANWANGSNDPELDKYYEFLMSS